MVKNTTRFGCIQGAMIDSLLALEVSCELAVGLICVFPCGGWEVLWVFIVASKLLYLQHADLVALGFQTFPDQGSNQSSCTGRRHQNYLITREVPIYCL